MESGKNSGEKEVRRLSRRVLRLLAEHGVDADNVDDLAGFYEKALIGPVHHIGKKAVAEIRAVLAGNDRMKLYENPYVALQDLSMFGAHGKTEILEDGAIVHTFSVKGSPIEMKIQIAKSEPSS